MNLFRKKGTRFLSLFIAIAFSISCIPKIVQATDTEIQSNQVNYGASEATSTVSSTMDSLIKYAGGIYFIPGVGEVAITVTGGVLLAGVAYYAGTYIFNATRDYIFSIEYEEAKAKGVPTDKHKKVYGTKEHNANPNVDEQEPYSSQDLYDERGLKQRRYFDGEGKAEIDIDYRHTDDDNTHTFPHRHTWDHSGPKPKRSKHALGITFIGWICEEGIWSHFSDNGELQTGWINTNGAWYYLDSNGELTTGWNQINGNWYFLQPVATQTIRLGQMATEWQSINGKMYYFGSDGIMKTNTWVQSPTTSKWYYVGSDGVMLTGWKQLDGKWFFLNDNVTRDDGVIGAMLVSWQVIDGKWYYFHTTTTGTVVKGEMATGWIQPDGYYYYLYPTTTGTVVKGQMAVGWTQINGKWYYFYSNGRMAANTTIDGYRLGSDGAMI